MNPVTAKVLVGLCVCPIVATPVIVAKSPKARTAVAKQMHKTANRIAPKTRQYEMPPCAPTMSEPPLPLPTTVTPPIQFAPMQLTQPPQFVQVPGQFIPPYEDDAWTGGGGGVKPGVPEPGTWVMMLTGFGAVGTLSRYRSKELSA